MLPFTYKKERSFSTRLIMKCLPQQGCLSLRGQQVSFSSVHVNGVYKLSGLNSEKNVRAFPGNKENCP